MKKALIIEDSDDIREGTAEILDLAGYETFTAKNGKIGVDLAIKHLPDIILCDIMMPELDGYGVLYLLQKNQQTANIPFIFMTAKAERADMRKGMEMGADDYLTKPFDDMELFNAIESRLKKKNKPAGFKSVGGNREALFESLKAKGKTRQFSNKQIIYVENDEPSYLYFLKTGQVKTYKRAKDGRELSSTLYRDGDFFGYESLCKSTVYADNAATLNDAEIILITKADFMEYLLNHQEIASAFIDMLSGSVQEKEEQMLRLAYFSVRKRVADALVQVADKFGEPGNDSCTLRVSRDDLAALVGTASETVSRMLADFKDEKLIEKNGNAIQILSIEKLRNVKQ
ncbi:response regulator [Pedobacter insulae]|uniref:cAMP-binding domain of CRP or a regulatory subunit of cAMP-dependent protein kinases n=1 Tax=Pedobacter insulae TaxID=414048 RepID=A0A1I3A1H6_9SPHI|nr:response regulator [Pedobacter insulae]SFH43904.1 cAMP-binding domain of CRP or a regulatory subunit of cAMP-dependent protein kinases [Pedobacter insulae]